jgi:hypothetical protein
LVKQGDCTGQDKAWRQGKARQCREPRRGKAGRLGSAGRSGRAKQVALAGRERLGAYAEQCA